MTDDLDTPYAQRLRALRSCFGWSQETLAERAGVARIEVLRAEGGRNRLSSFKMRAGLAKAFGLSVEHFAAYLDGELSYDSAVEMARIGGSLAAKAG